MPALSLHKSVECSGRPIAMFHAEYREACRGVEHPGDQVKARAIPNGWSSSNPCDVLPTDVLSDNVAATFLKPLPEPVQRPRSGVPAPRLPGPRCRQVGVRR